MITGKENYQILNGYVTMVTEPCFLFMELYEQRNNLFAEGNDDGL